MTFQGYIVVILSLTLIFSVGNGVLFYVVNLQHKRILTVLSRQSYIISESLWDD